jgi:hypothetical protein
MPVKAWFWASSVVVSVSLVVFVISCVLLTFGRQVGVPAYGKVTLLFAFAVTLFAAPGVVGSQSRVQRAARWVIRLAGCNAGFFLALLTLAVVGKPSPHSSSTLCFAKCRR